MEPVSTRPLEFLYAQPERALPLLCLLVSAILGIALNSLEVAAASGCILLSLWHYWAARLVILDQRLGPVRIQCPGASIWLTFDDGPGPETLSIVRILNEFECSATFFFIGEQVERYQDMPELSAALREGGHSVANHSYSHPNFLGLSEESTRQEIERTQEILNSALPDLTLPMFRPPFGYRKRETMAVADRLGLEVVGWSINSLDFLNCSPRQLVQRMKAQIESSKIVLFHDGRADREVTVSALPLFLQELKARGHRTYNPLLDVDPSPKS